MAFQAKTRSKTSRRFPGRSIQAGSRLRHSQHSRTSNRLGAAAVEFAVVTPFMLALSFGLIELGRLSMLKENAIHASREGARIGIRMDVDQAQVIEQSQRELNLMGVENAEVVVNFTEEASSGSQYVSVDVNVPLEGNTWAAAWLSHGLATIDGRTVMRRESTR